MIADRNTPELDRRALEGLLLMAQRGKHISSTRLPAIADASQHFVKAREEIASGRTQSGLTALQRGLDTVAGVNAPEPRDDE